MNEKIHCNVNTLNRYQNMTKEYQIDINLYLDLNGLTERDVRDYVRKEMLLFFVFPSLMPNNRNDFLIIKQTRQDIEQKQQEQWATEWMICGAKGKKSLHQVQCRVKRTFGNDYTEEMFQLDIEEQEERMKTVIPWDFNATISATRIDRQPDVCVTIGNPSLMEGITT